MTRMIVGTLLGMMWAGMLLAMGITGWRFWVIDTMAMLTAYLVAVTEGYIENQTSTGGAPAAGGVEAPTARK